jgi:hypothetical protein
MLVTEEKSGKPAKFKIHKRLNLLHPEDDMTIEELEGEWGNPKDFKDDMSEAELERIRKKISSRKIKPH